MVQYKLTYFNVRGRGEVARLILHYAQVPFEDYRIEKEDWPKLKPTCPFGQLPILEVDGKVLAQSNAIARYLAKEHGLAGKDNWEQAQVDMYVDCISDIMTGLRAARMEPDAEKKKEMFAKYNAEAIQPLFAKLEQNLVKSGTGFLVGNSLTSADLAYYSLFVPLAGTVGEATLFGNTPHLKKLMDHVGNIPQIKKYVDARPKTDI